MDNKTASGDKQHATPSHFDIFKGPPRHVARVTKALTAYMEKVEGMKNANAHLLTTMVDMCPKTWKILPELKIYLEDQSMLWSLAVSSIRPLFKALRNYETTTQGAKDALLEFEVRLNQVKTMSAEYELIKKSSRVSKVQQFQIEYMLRESGRALVNTRKVVEERMLKFRRLQTELGKELLGTFEDVMKVTCSEGCQVSDLIQNTLRASPVKKTNKNGQPVDDLNFVQKQVQVVVDKVGSTPADVSSKRRLNTPEKPKAKLQATQSQLESQGKARTKVVLAPTQPQAQAHPQTEPITRYERREQDRPVSASQNYQFRNEARRQSLENYTEFNRTACPFHCVATQEQVKMSRVSRPKTSTPDVNSSPRSSSEYNARQEYRYDDQGGVRAVTYTTTRAKTRHATPSNGNAASGRHSRSSNADADDYACYLDSCGMSPRPPTPGRQRNNNGNTDQVALTEEQRRGTKTSSEQDRQTRLTQTTAQTQGQSGRRKSGLPFQTSIPDSSLTDNVFFDCR